MKKTVIATVGLALLIALGTAAFAEPFEQPPEEYAPGWAWGFPYQRNIVWDFEIDPRVAPPPGNGAEYEGTLDPLLWDSDSVDLAGEVGWLANYGTLPYGLVGIFNTTTQPASGEIIFHLDNTLWPINHKHMWFEWDFALGPNVQMDEPVLIPGPGDPASYDVLDWMSAPRVIDPVAGLLRQNAWVRIQPNPFWEELRISFTVPPGEYAFLDQMHIATECIPEPASVLLFGLGLAGLVFCGYRRIRRR